MTKIIVKLFRNILMERNKILISPKLGRERYENKTMKQDEICDFGLASSTPVSWNHVQRI